VHKGLIERWGEDYYKKTLLCGGSAGTIFAVGIALGKTPEEMGQLYSRAAIKSAKYGTIQKASMFMEESLRIMIDNPMAYKLIEGRCCFGTTAFFSNHRWHIGWEDNEDLIATIMSSCHIPFYCKRNDGIRGVSIIDGAYGFGGLDLPHGDRTLFVGIDPHAEITRLFTNNEMFFPAVDENYEKMVESGYIVTKNWDGKYLTKVLNRKPNYSALYILWFLKFLEIIFYFFLTKFSDLHFLLFSIVHSILEYRYRNLEEKKFA
jgi:hypothetical protein